MKRSPLLICLLLLLLLVPGGVTAADTPAPTLKSITPSSGETNTTVSITSLTGTDFSSRAGMRLKSYSSKEIAGSVSSVKNGTQIVGTFNLYKQAPGDYLVCVYNSESIYACGLTFTITTPVETATGSSVFFDTYPTGATISLNGTKVGTSVFTYRNATPGTYKVLVQKSGYEDYTGSVTVREGTRVKFYAQLTPLGARITAAPATPVKTATTIRKSTMIIPTTWPSTVPTAVSPVDPALVIGAAGMGIGLIVIRRR